MNLSTSMSEQIADARKAGKKIGLVQGSWDMFHLGHLCYLQEARKTCDFLIVAMDDDEKIRHRKGPNRPIIPLDERYQTIDRLGIADLLIVKKLGEPHWGLIKTIRPDVLIAIKENYSDEEIEQLGEFCASVKILPRQATTSTSDIIRRTLIKNGVKAIRQMDPRVFDVAKNLRERVTHGLEQLPEPWDELFNQVRLSTDWKTPTAAAYKWNDEWYYGINQVDQSLDQNELDNRTELFYGTVEHAEISLLKQLRGLKVLDGPVYMILFPCDRCMKVLADKGLKTVYYLEDHPEKGWSKRSHAMAREKGIRTIQVTFDKDGNAIEHEDGDTEEKDNSRDYKALGKKVLTVAESNEKYGQYKYIDPRNAREQEQLNIMLDNEAHDRDPFDPKNIQQEVIAAHQYWYVSENRFPYPEIEHQFLIIAKGNVYSFEAMSQKMWLELQKITRDLKEEFEIPGGAICLRFGDTLCSGASLKRLHAHLIVPKPGSRTKFGVGGKLDLGEGLVI